MLRLSAASILLLLASSVLFGQHATVAPPAAPAIHVGPPPSATISHVAPIAPANHAITTTTPTAAQARPAKTVITQQQPRSNGFWATLFHKNHHPELNTKECRSRQCQSQTASLNPPATQTEITPVQPCPVDEIWNGKMCMPTGTHSVPR